LREFNFSTHAVQETFLTFMPRKYTLDGMGKTNLTLGPSKGKPQYSQLINVNIYFVEDFDFRAYFAGSLAERNEMLLSALETSLLDIASRSHADPAPIRTAISESRHCGCERRYTIPRLSKCTRSRALKLNVFRHVFTGGESWGIDITNRKGQVLQIEWIAKKTDFFRAAHDFRRSSIGGNEFVIVDFLGRETYKLNLVELEAKLICNAKASSVMVRQKRRIK
jgi:hypothetical protein